MACYHPLSAYRTKVGQIVWKALPEASQLRLPCGGCIGCRKAQARAWALRCHLELERHSRASFATLTYDDEHLPVTLSRRHLQLFLKRARRSIPARALRFFASGEYGEQNGRPHYHAILYGTEDEQLVHDAWKAGHTQTRPVTPARIAYVAGYSAKKIGWRLELEERIDYSTGEIYTWQPPFIQMSRRPGIGAHARQWVNSWKRHAVHNGVRLPVPRYLHEAWKAQATPEQIEALAIEKATQASLRDTSRHRLAAAERIEQSHQEMQAGRRKL